MNIIEPNQVLNIRLGNLVARPTETDKLSANIAKSALVCEYTQEWAKAIRNNNIIIGTVDLSTSGVWIERVELELNAKINNAFIRVLADKTKTHWAKISYFTEGNEIEGYIKQTQELNETVLHKVLCSGDYNAHEAEITTDELFRILSSKCLCIKLEDVQTTIIKFATREINALLKENNSYSLSAKAEQISLQQNLEYNLKHKAKQYLQNPNFKEDLADQFEKLKLRMLTEVNLPKLVNANNNVPKWKNYKY